MRRHHALKGLMRVARVDVVVTTDVRDDDLVTMRRDYGVDVVSVQGHQRQRTRRLTRQRLPRRVQGRDPGSLRTVLDDRGASYDCAFVERVDDLLILGDSLRVPIVVDLDDLDSQLLTQQRRLLWRNALRAPSRRLRNVPQTVRRALLLACRVPTTAARYLIATTELHRWQDAERRAVATSTVALTCSRDDARSLPTSPNVLVVPNGFDRQGAPAGRIEVGEPPTVAFWGSFDYLPNTDGARWFIESVLPRIHRMIPSLRVLFIGRGSEHLRTADSRIEATGFVPDLTPFLRQTDVAVVPLRLGGGTRIKIVEAWAHGIPVVSTSVGAHGLDAVSGREAMIADRPVDFANAIVEVLRDAEARQKLRREGTSRAAALGWDAVEHLFAEAAIRSMSVL